MIGTNYTHTLMEDTITSRPSNMGDNTLYISFYSSPYSFSPIKHTNTAAEDQNVFEFSDASVCYQKFQEFNRQIVAPCHVVVRDDTMYWVSCGKDHSSEHWNEMAFPPAENSVKVNTDVIKRILLSEAGRYPCDRSLPLVISSAELLGSSTSNAKQDNHRATNCHLSVRLMDGKVVRSTFSENECLLDVKRWLQQENHIPQVPEDDAVISNYVQIGYLEKFRHAFFFPSTRHTFTESEELLRLKDIGLHSRLCLILRPDYDPSAQVEDPSTGITTSWETAISRMGNLLQALYQFFDYGVDEAQKDLQDFTDSLEHKDYGTPHFLGTAPATGSLVNITTASDPAKISDTNESSYLNVASRAGSPLYQVTETKMAHDDS
ncbi:hypothetical protein PUMCH_000145 [Australozyma saopauloensis]|uniref:UBX domain-containing protein n=1 Tax=Australozyma saopauloensis TaxID=291208 RepID=A0AAX4H304_9ASCO|nr:hypothetical protein PUMCH_000145 [[Candida] saopauloensis]